MRNRTHRCSPLARFVALSFAAFTAFTALLGACDPQDCPSERFVVDETGTCADGPQRFEIASDHCRVSLRQPLDGTGLPSQGALSEEPAPLRNGGFILYTSSPAFRLCRARRVDFHLQLSCVDGQGAPVCEASLTEQP